MPTARVLPLATLCLAFGVAEAQAPAALSLTANARSAALGDAYVLSVVESDAVFHHPGVVDGARGVSLSRAWLGSAGAAVTASGAGEWLRGGLAFGVQALNGAGRAEQVASLGYGRSMFGFRVGVVAKAVDQSDGGPNETYGAADVGVARAVGPGVVALAARNLGPDPSFASGEGRLPSTVTLGAASRSRALGPLDMLLALRASWPQDADFGFGGGIELSYWPVSGRTFSARVGFNEDGDDASDPLTLGAGFSGDRISIDYAFQAGEAGGSTELHRLTLRWR